MISLVSGDSDDFAARKARAARFGGQVVMVRAAIECRYSLSLGAHAWLLAMQSAAEKNAIEQAKRLERQRRFGGSGGAASTNASKVGGAPVGLVNATRVAAQKVLHRQRMPPR